MDNIKSITPDLSQIKDNTPALKIGNQYFANGIGGNFIPAGTKTQNFYKCASVGTGTWTGYLASVDPVTGVWSFAETATTGLTYDRLTPVVEKVYDEECTFIVSGYKPGLPEDGLIFYLALADEIGDTDDTGTYTLTKANTNYSFDNKNGILCMKLGTGAKIYGPNFNSVLPNTSSTRYTVSFWACGTPDSNTTYQGPTGGFLYNTNYTYGTSLRVCYSSIIACYDGRIEGVSVENANMAFFYMIYDGTRIEWYKNGQRVYNKTSAVPFGSSFTNTYPCICMETSNSGGYGDGYMAAFRIYNRVLTSEEITALANEFTPTA